MQELLKSIRENQIVSGIVLLAGGVCLLFFPAGLLKILIRIAGIVLILMGGLGAAEFLGTREHDLNGNLQFAINVVAFILGLFAVIAPHRVLAMLGTILGLMLIMSSLRVLLRLYSRGVAVKSWPMIQGLAVLAAGIVFLFIPSRMVQLAARAGGILFIIQAATNFLGGYAAASVNRNNNR